MNNTNTSPRNRRATPVSQVIKRRNQMVRKGLSRLIGKEIPCPCLGGVLVRVERKSVNETANKAANSILSMEAARHLEHYLKTAKFYRMTLPKENRSQKKDFGLIFMYELHAQSKGGVVKLMVGVRERGDARSEYGGRHKLERRVLCAFNGYRARNGMTALNRYDFHPSSAPLL